MTVELIGRVVSVLTPRTSCTSLGGDWAEGWSGIQYSAVFPLEHVSFFPRSLSLVCFLLLGESAETC